MKNIFTKYFQFVEQKYITWSCWSIGVALKDFRLFWIHWHYGPNEFHLKPKFRLRSFEIFEKDVPFLRRYDS